MTKAARFEIRFEPGRVDDGPGEELISAMRDEMALMYDGLQFDGDTMPKAGQRELSPPGGDFTVGWVDGEPICCGGVKRLDGRACEIKRMYVVPSYRGQGVARRLLRELEDRARALGYSLARLDTGPRQEGAQHLYESAGYRPIGNFNANPVASFWGEKPLR
ncbi:MAG TPA: GNAT family N-acetyltransferase [Solirubrobacteraceae bacterium]